MRSTLLSVHSMGPTLLAELEGDGLARVAGDRVVFAIDRGWTAPGEQRIGYPGILRLVECVRELHWARDVVPPAAGRPIDSITRSLTADFLAPLEGGDELTGRYRIEWCRERSYALEVLLSSTTSAVDLVRASLVSVFYDPVGRTSTSPPTPVLMALRASGSTGLTSRKPTV